MYVISFLSLLYLLYLVIFVVLAKSFYFNFYERFDHVINLSHDRPRYLETLKVMLVFWFYLSAH